MTNKEAIDIIQHNTNVGYGIVIEGSTEKINQALDLAIKALEERPQGEWVIRNQDNEGIHKIECPFCKCVKGSDFGGLITIIFDRFPPFCENCGADMRGKEKMTELPQYHFDRDDFVRVWYSVLDDSATDDVLDMCDVHNITDNFEMWRDEDEYYIKYLPNGVTINWYKGTHLGRTNTCTDPNFTLDDSEKFLVQLKRDICGGKE